MRSSERAFLAKLPSLDGGHPRTGTSSVFIAASPAPSTVPGTWRTFKTGVFVCGKEGVDQRTDGKATRNRNCITSDYTARQGRPCR